MCWRAPSTCFQHCSFHRILSINSEDHPDNNTTVPTQPKLRIIAANTSSSISTPSTAKATDASDPSHSPAMVAAVTVQQWLFFQLPAELLYELTTYFTTKEIRLLRRIRQRFYYFVAEWLSKYRYKSALFRLPEHVLKSIATYLPLEYGCFFRRLGPCNLARINQILYPALMESMVRIKIKDSTDYFLFNAARTGDMALAREILRLRGDANGKDLHWRYNGSLGHSLLQTAALYGQVRMVQMLLRSGSSHISDPFGCALEIAIHQRHEYIACMLIEDPSHAHIGYPEWSKPQFLHRTCHMRVVILSRYLLERGQPRGSREDIV